MSKFLVSSAVVRHQSIELPDGTAIAVQMATPASAFVVVFENGAHREILSIHPDEETAVHRCKELVALVETGGVQEQGEAGGRRTLQ
ncbi:hypothetical protein M8994_14390 [Brucella sp. 21LCYQ03]|nr:hypothetical protein [Brucella sp. 21LCYQ03]